MSLPPALTGSAPSERMRMPSGPTKSASLAKNVGRRSRAGASQPPMKGGSALLMWLAARMSGPWVGKTVHALDAHTRDRLQAEAAQAGDEARVEGQALVIAHVGVPPVLHVGG